MKRQFKIHVALASMVLLIITFQNCSDDVVFSTIPVQVTNLADLRWNAIEGQKVATTSAIQKMDWNKDGVEDVVFAYSNGMDKITEICMSTKVHKMQSNCFPLGLDNPPAPEDGSPQTFLHNVATTSISIADLDRDGRMDIVEFNSGRNISSYVIFNRGMTNGRPNYLRQPFHNHSYASSLYGSVIDYDDDGDLDIAFVEMVVGRCNASGSNGCTAWGISSNGSSGSPVTLKLNVVKNQGDFSTTSSRSDFVLPNTWLQNSAPNLFNKVLGVKQINNKKALLFINDRFEDHYIIKFANSRPLISTVPKLEYTGNFWAGFVSDLDKDGFEDFVHLCSAGADSEIYYGKSDGTFEAVKLPDSCQLSGANAVDINKDGYMDIVAGSYRSAGMENSYEIIVYMGEPNRIFSGREVIQTNTPNLYELNTPIEFINIDGNQWMDFIVGTRNAKDMLMITTRN